MPDVSQKTGLPVDQGTGVRGPILAGSAIIALFFGGLGVWAAVAPLESAAIASGLVSVDTNRKTIQHLEGGIVGEILVRDGEVVRRDQVLIRLDGTGPRATLDLLKGRRLAASALGARLIAERDGRAEVQFPDNLVAQVSETKVIETLDGQINIFRARRKAIASQVKIQELQISQILEEIGGLKGQIRAENLQQKLIRSEIADLRVLVGKGLARKPRLLALQRRLAEIEGSRSRNQANIARAKQRIGEARIRITEIRTNLLNEVLVELRNVRAELFDLSERIRAAEDVLGRTDIRAPLAGTVVGLQVHTRGGVIAPGAALMDIVPSDEKLVIEANVDPIDIDVVHRGLEAQVRITAFSMRNAKPLKGRVMSVSADRLIDERTGQAYYRARIELTENPAKAFEGATLYPGMPAEVMIVTGARTALGYIFNPISSSFNRAFREQ
jgi:HlyD family type I secretion membrane fusion protein